MNPPALFLLDELARAITYGPAERERLDRMLDWIAPPQTAASWTELGSSAGAVEIIVSGWGMPVVDESFLRQFSKLKAIFYAAGSIRPFMSKETWSPRLRISSAAKINAIPVAEFTFAQIILCLKGVWKHAQAMRATRCFHKRNDWPMPGAYGSTVGLLSLGAIGSLVAERLKTLEVDVIAFDPHVDPGYARALGVRLCTLEEVFAAADVVSCHVPALPSTRRMIRGAHFDSMKPEAGFINTARGSVVAEDEMVDALRRRPDLFAVLDVTEPEPPSPRSPLFDLPNVQLSPHIAGSVGRECQRMGRAMTDEVQRFIAGHPLQHEVVDCDFALLA